MNHNKKIIICFLVVVGGLPAFGTQDVKADKQLENNELKIKSERIINDKGNNDKNSSSSDGLFNSQDSKIRKDIQKKNEQKLESGKKEIFSKYYTHEKPITAKQLFEKKTSSDVKISSGKEVSKTPVLGSVIGGLTAIVAGFGVSLGVGRKE